jgi:hypothetical protein
MENQVFRADGGCAFQFAPEALDGFAADHRVERRQINQIVHVDNQRVQIEPLAGVFKKFDLLGVGRFGAPHARAGGEDLEGVRPEFRRFKRSFLEATAGGGMNAEAQNAYIVSERLSSPII